VVVKEKHMLAPINVDGTREGPEPC
jgi:hypothetical protein